MAPKWAIGPRLWCPRQASCVSPLWGIVVIIPNRCVASKKQRMVAFRNIHLLNIFSFISRIDRDCVNNAAQPCTRLQSRFFLINRTVKTNEEHLGIGQQCLGHIVRSSLDLHSGIRLCQRRRWVPFLHLQMEFKRHCQPNHPQIPRAFDTHYQ